MRPDRGDDQGAKCDCSHVVQTAARKGPPQSYEQVVTKTFTPQKVRFRGFTHNMAQSPSNSQSV